MPRRPPPRSCPVLRCGTCRRYDVILVVSDDGTKLLCDGCLMRDRCRTPRRAEPGPGDPGHRDDGMTGRR